MLRHLGSGARKPGLKPRSISHVTLSKWPTSLCPSFLTYKFQKIKVPTIMVLLKKKKKLYKALETTWHMSAFIINLMRAVCQHSSLFHSMFLDSFPMNSSFEMIACLSAVHWTETFDPLTNLHTDLSEYSFIFIVLPTKTQVLYDTMQSHTWYRHYRHSGQWLLTELCKLLWTQIAF